MKAGAALLLVAMLAIQPICVLGGNVAGRPDPAGEKVYAAHLLVRVAPIAIIVGQGVVRWLLARARRKAEKILPDAATWQHC